MLRWIFFAVLEEELTVATQARDNRTTFSILKMVMLAKTSATPDMYSPDISAPAC